MNWKPYWKLDDQVSILHFHGLKPTLESQARNGLLTGKLKELLEQSGEAYYEYVALWQSYAEAADTSFLYPTFKVDISPKMNGRHLPEVIAFHDQTRTREAYASGYGEIVSHLPIQNASWRVIKGELILWLLGKPDNSDAYMETSHYLAVVGEFEAALVHARLAYQFAPDSAPVMLWLASLFEQRGNLAAARRVLELGSALTSAANMQDLQLLIQLGRICLQMQDHQSALTAFRKALTLDSASDEALRGIEAVLRLRSAPNT